MQCTNDNRRLTSRYTKASVTPGQNDWSYYRHFCAITPILLGLPMSVCACMRVCVQLQQVHTLISTKCLSGFQTRYVRWVKRRFQLFEDRRKQTDKQSVASDLLHFRRRNKSITCNFVSQAVAAETAPPRSSKFLHCPFASVGGGECWRSLTVWPLKLDVVPAASSLTCVNSPRDRSSPPPSPPSPLFLLLHDAFIMEMQLSPATIENQMAGFDSAGWEEQTREWRSERWIIGPAEKLRSVAEGWYLV